MPTYDYTTEAAGARPSWDAHQRMVCYKKTLKVADIIASDTTLTANGVIAAGDVIQAIQVKQDFIALGSALRTVTPEGGALTADIGIAGGDEFQDGVSINAAAGSIALTLVGDDYGPDNLTGKAFTANDTIDFTFVSETDAGEWDLYVWGVLLDDQ